MNRWAQVAAWVKDLNPQKGAEIGVKEGRFITHLLYTYPGLTMYAVDPWEDQPGKSEDYMGWNWSDIYGQYKVRVAGCKDRVIELREYSEQAAEKVEDGTLDFVFIDAQHDYHSVKQDIELWEPKVRTGGILSGHDYQPRFPGVINAVNESYKDFILGGNDTWMTRI